MHDYGLYSAFLALGMSSGVWSNWYNAKTSILTIFTITYLLGTLGSAINNTVSAVWCSIIIGLKRKIKDLFRSIITKPGRTIILATFIGGPILSSSYVIALHMAGSIIIPISAPCPSIGAILGRILVVWFIEMVDTFGFPFPA